MDESTNVTSGLFDDQPRNPLLPIRHDEPDFFVCDIFDATPKSDQASMRFPLFTLSTKPDMTPREYQEGPIFVRLSPSEKGLATVHDRDVLIYAVSQCMAKLKRGQRVERKMRFHPHDLMVATNRETTGGSYRRFRDTLLRLRSTTIETNITMGGQEVMEGFGFIDGYKVVRETRDGRMQLVEITLSEWLFNAINERGKDLLTISREYFRLRKPLERRLYDLARKYCGRDERWQIRLSNLRPKTGSTSTLGEFRRMVRSIVDANEVHDHFPDYHLQLNDDLLIVRPRAKFTNAFLKGKDSGEIDASSVRLPSDIHDLVRKEAKGYDVHMLERNWREMLNKRESVPENPVGSFRGYVRWYVRENGPAR
jgi:hypothetical protein